MTASGDLASLSAPAFLLSGISVLELEEAYCCYPEVFADINRATDPSGNLPSTAFHTLTLPTKT